MHVHILPEIIFLIFKFFLAGVAVGAGWQGVVAFVNVGCLYILGIPLGVFLAYVAHLSVRVRGCLSSYSILDIYISRYRSFIKW